MEQKDIILTKFLISVSIGKLSNDRPSRLKQCLTRHDVFIPWKAEKGICLWEKHAEMTLDTPLALIPAIFSKFKQRHFFQPKLDANLQKKLMCGLQDI